MINRLRALCLHKVDAFGINLSTAVCGNGGSFSSYPTTNMTTVKGQHAFCMCVCVFI